MIPVYCGTKVGARTGTSYKKRRTKFGQKWSKFRNNVNLEIQTRIWNIKNSPKKF